MWPNGSMMSFMAMLFPIWRAFKKYQCWGSNPTPITPDTSEGEGCAYTLGGLRTCVLQAFSVSPCVIRVGTQGLAMSPGVSFNLSSDITKHLGGLPVPFPTAF